MIVSGQKAGTVASAPLPLAADGLSVAVSGTLTAVVDESTLATSAKQDTGNASLASVDTKTPSKGTAVMTGSTPVTIATNDTLVSAMKTDLDTIAASAAGSKTAGQATMANSVPVVLASNQTAIPDPLSTSTDTGQNLGATGSAAAFGTSQAATQGVFVSSLLANTDKVYVGLGSGVTAGKGLELIPGDTIFLPRVANSNLVYVIAASGTQNCHALAV